MVTGCEKSTTSFQLSLTNSGVTCFSLETAPLALCHLVLPIQPPPTSKVSPVVLTLSEDKTTNKGDTKPGSYLLKSFLEKMVFVMAVSACGAIQFTLMPALEPSCANVFVKPVIPHLAAP
ncbi:hypothetical protein WICPIJ_002533 [Wickerhamomyces pijperi]|uniref:Uncharacterized protein n=1 Tax=Wickerhamomyces pijperi TaxID=599730 RepID=A0A9P8TPR7_WICPI|nr:hypothetical protein WICPIJ_002533 [Wickerhamomyces pijperi]